MFEGFDGRPGETLKFGTAPRDPDIRRRGHEYVRGVENSTHKQCKDHPWLRKDRQV